MNDLARQIASLIQAQQGGQANPSQLSNVVQGSLVPQLGNMLTLHNGPRSKKLRNLDEVSQIRRRAFQIETSQGDRIDIQEEVIWFGEEQ